MSTTASRLASTLWCPSSQRRLKVFIGRKRRWYDPKTLSLRHIFYTVVFMSNSRGWPTSTSSSLHPLLRVLPVHPVTNQPLVMVIGISMLKEAVEDTKRHKKITR